jgi:hypothetical protein
MIGLGHSFEHAREIVAFEGVAFAGAPAGDQPMHAGGNLEFDNFGQGRMNDIALRVEGGGNWRDNAAKITKHGRSFFCPAPARRSGDGVFLADYWEQA